MSEVISLDDVMARLTKQLALRNLTKATRFSYRRVVGDFFRQTGLAPGDVCREHIRDYMLSHIERGLSDSEIVGYFGGYFSLVIFCLYNNYSEICW